MDPREHQLSALSARSWPGSNQPMPDMSRSPVIALAICIALTAVTQGKA